MFPRSRPKAAGFVNAGTQGYLLSFHTQPPTAAGFTWLTAVVRIFCFNAQPPEAADYPEGRLLRFLIFVSTHSRPKAAGNAFSHYRCRHCSFDTQPPGRRLELTSFQPDYAHVSAHSRPKAAGGYGYKTKHDSVSTHSRPKAAGLIISNLYL